VARAIFEAGLIRRTRHTVVDPRRLSQILAEVRRRGYAATDEELEEGISSVAAPVRVAGDQRGRAVAGDQRGRAVAAVSVVGPSQRLHRDGITTIAAHVQDAARRIGEAVASG
jgi:IclR family KDG regulon transcriptional repressor